MPVRRRRYVLVGLFVAVALVTASLLRGVLATVFFAITVAYVLYPLRTRLADRGVGPRIAAAICTLTAFLVGLLLLAPLVGVVYFRRSQLFAFLRELPDSIAVSVGEFAYAVELETVVESSRGVVESLAVGVARASPAIALKVFLFTLLVYALLLRPAAARPALLGPVPRAYHDIVTAFHERTRSVLYGIYVLQAAVAVGTFLIALVVFWALGYDAVFTLAVVAGALQFIPILGPSILIAVLALLEVLAGDAVAAAVVAVVGVVVVGLLPDALIRPRLASRTSGLPGSLYFVGFTGGVLSVGVVGVIAGPVAVALLVEAASLLSTEADVESVQQRLS